MWEAPERGKIEGTIEQLARMVASSNGDFEQFLKEAESTKFADVTLCNKNVTLINRRMLREEKQRNNTRLRVAKLRSNAACNDDVTLPSSSSSSSSCTKVHNNNCPQSEIVDLFREVIPEAIKPRDWGPERQTLLRARWSEEEKRQNLEWWKNLFLYIRKCPFLMGEVDPSPGHKRFLITLPWLVKKGNLLKVIEGNYERTP